MAATLPNKSVRDVALRVRWIGRKDTPRKQRSKVRDGVEGRRAPRTRALSRGAAASQMPPPPPVDLPLPPAPKRSRTPKEPRTEGSRPGGSHFSLGPPAVSHLGSRAHMGHPGSHSGRNRGSELGMYTSAPLPLLSADDLAAQGVRASNRVSRWRALCWR